MTKKIFIYFLLFFLIFNISKAQSKLSIERIEVSNDYVFNNPLIKVFVENEGNETINLLNESLIIDKNYIIYSEIPEKIEPNDVWTLIFKVDELLCEDYLQTFNFTVEVYYGLGAQVYSVESENSLYVKNPLVFTDLEPNPSNGFNIFLGEIDSMKFSVINKGLRALNYNFELLNEPDMIHLKFRGPDQNYELREFMNETFTINGEERQSYEVEIIPTGLKNNYLQMNINNSLGCDAIKDSINAFINVNAKVNNVVKVVITPGIRFVDVFILLILSCFLFMLVHSSIS